jgi:lipoprotein-anchoring transpeptidase ErfK/SrfK
MMPYFVSPKCKQTWLRPARLAIASWAAVIAAGDHAGAAGGRNERAMASFESRTAGESTEPIMAIVSLRSQRITVYDAKSWILRAPVSSGQKGRETPAGIFSVIQKEAEHYSNLYDDAYMPHMQRITWSGIALHGGPLPGHPASHGCVRMPYDFARRLFGLTKLGMRVIVAPSDVAPVEIVH